MRTIVVLGGLSTLLGVLVGCGSYEDEDHFIERAAVEQCKVTRKCYLAGYLDEYSDMDDCVDETQEYFEDLADLADDFDCDYEEDKAAECIDAIKQSISCEDDDLEDAYEACFEDVYDC